MPFLSRLLLLLALVLWLPWGSSAQAQVRRCTRPDGTAVFTDQKCAELGAADRLPRASSEARGLRLRQVGCSRNLQDLVYEMTTAIDAQDANRLASVYHWVGISSSGAESVMSRLDAIVHRPLVDIIPVTARPPEDVDDPDGSGNPGVSDDYYPQTTVRAPTVALRVEQTLANGSTPSHTVFGLRRHFDCWWVSL
ncbi:hypothetical protein [Lysobacter sp. CFH 32150]|uniref:hypothetical protein n=1 Tax=Lysobacter sp. CFH 32150 TaxID=2927128 RepID=UPI001FA72C92|nr:hypothetical protein [Lysobacter sp. CFH 32150]MCI4568642.1 hypothetical protein [Lysobacter sp. CFH 32150]